ncbi:MAG: TetR/AcrR family transcriptional regulator [Acidimicrobiales bacterium]
MTPGGAGRSEGPATEGADWRGRVLRQSLARSERSVRQRGIGPAQRIVEAALALSEETGGATFSIQQVVTRAKVALQTFYRHFGSKDALLLAMLEESVGAGTAAMRRQVDAEPDPLVALHRLVTEPIAAGTAGQGASMSAIVREHYRLLELFPEEVARSSARYAAVVAETIRRAGSAGLVEPFDVDAQADLIGDLVLSQFHRVRLAATHVPASELAERCWRFCFASLSPTEKGARRAAALPGIALEGSG